MACRLPTIQAGPCPVAAPHRHQSTPRRGLAASKFSVRYPHSSGMRHQAPRTPLRALEKDDQTSGGTDNDSEALPSDGTAPQTSKAAIMAKLEAAKKYKEAMGGTFSSSSPPPSPASPSATAPPAAAAMETDDAVMKQQAARAPMPPTDGEGASSVEQASSAPKETSDVVAKFLATGEEGRARVESNLLSALQDASDAASTDAADGSDEPSQEQKLFRARSQQADVKPTQGDSSGLYARERARASAELAADVADQDGAEGSSPEAARTGSSQQAARFLGATMEQQKQRAEGTAPSMEEGQRMEEFLLAKEQKVKDQEVEIISVDKNYKPKVSTWGMFPRPDNISKAYGGGKTLRPEDLVETEEQKKEREQAVRDRVRAYKISQGLLIDESTEEECRKLFETGMMVMKEGRLNEAAELFKEVGEKVVLKSEWGGRSALQRALCLDSLGRTEEAGQIYKLIRNHPQVDVAKRAKQMMFGIDSMDFLKTHSISYGVGKEDYAGYFRRISSDWDTIYLPTSEEDEISMRWQAAVAVMVMATPLVTIAGVMLTK